MSLDIVQHIVHRAADATRTYEGVQVPIGCRRSVRQMRSSQPRSKVIAQFDDRIFHFQWDADPVLQ